MVATPSHVHLIIVVENLTQQWDNLAQHQDKPKKLETQKKSVTSGQPR